MAHAVPSDLMLSTPADHACGRQARKQGQHVSKDLVARPALVTRHEGPWRQAHTGTWERVRSQPGTKCTDSSTPMHGKLERTRPQACAHELAFTSSYIQWWLDEFVPGIVNCLQGQGFVGAQCMRRARVK